MIDRQALTLCVFGETNGVIISSVYYLFFDFPSKVRVVIFTSKFLILRRQCSSVCIALAQWCQQIVIFI